MRTLVVYSSSTGNTLRVAGAVARGVTRANRGVVLKVDVYDVPDPGAFGLIFVGFWVDRGKPDADSLAFMKTLQGKRVAFFFTLGAASDSELALGVAEDVKRLLELGGNDVLGHFACQGRVDPALIGFLKKTLSMSNARPFASPVRRASEIGESHHPDPLDLANATAFAVRIVQKVEGGLGVEAKISETEITESEISEAEITETEISEAPGPERRSALPKGISA